MKCGHLPQGVDSRIGPPAGQQTAGLPGDLLDGRFQRSLHGRHAGLNLPTGIRCAVVSQGQLDASHRMETRTV